MQVEAEYYRASIADSNYNSYTPSLQDELNADAQTQLQQLKFEKMQLEASVDEIKEKSFYEMAQQILELEKAKKKLSLDNDHLKKEAERSTQANKITEELFDVTMKENESLQTHLDALKTLTEEQTHELSVVKERNTDLLNKLDDCKKEKENLLLLFDTVKSRADKSENTIVELMKTIESMKMDVKKGREMEMAKEKLEEDIESLKKDISGLKNELVKTKEELEVGYLQVIS